MENRTRLEHGQHNKIGTWTTEQDWNMDNRTKLEHGQQNENGTWTTEQDFTRITEQV
jgi:hypothetical protein